MTNYIPTHLRHLPFDLAFTLDADDTLMCTVLREDKSFSRRLSDYEAVDLDLWREDHQHTLMLIHNTLLGY